MNKGILTLLFIIFVTSNSLSAQAFNEKIFFAGFGFAERYDLLTSTDRVYDLAIALHLDQLEVSSYFSIVGDNKYIAFDLSFHLNTIPDGLIQPFLNTGLSVSKFSSNDLSSGIAPVFDIGIQLSKTGYFMRVIHKSKLVLLGKRRGIVNATYFSMGKKI